MKKLKKNKKQKLNYTQNLTETNVKRSFLYLKIINIKPLKEIKTKKFNYLKFKHKSQNFSEKEGKIFHEEKEQMSIQNHNLQLY